MARDVEALVLQLSADIRGLERQMTRAGQVTDRNLKTIEDRFTKANGRLRRSSEEMANGFRRSIAAIGVGVAIRGVTGFADAWTDAGNKLAAAGVGADQLGSTMREVAALAQATRSEFAGVADLYARIARSSDQLGLSQAEVLKLTENVAKALVAGGASAAEQASTITQLGQALGSGRLGGDELRGLLENAPVLARAIANEFGVAVGELKQLGSEGKLAGDRVAKAILNATEIQEQFNKTVITVRGSINNLQTAFTQYIGESEKAGAATKALAGFIDTVAKNFDTFGNAAVVAASILGGTLAAGAIAKLIGSLGTMVTSVRTAATAMGALRTAMTFFTGPVGATILAIGGALVTLGVSAGRAESPIDRLSDGMQRLQTLNAKIKSDTDELAQANNRLTQAIESQGAAAQETARLEISAIQRRLAENKKLAQSTRSQLQAQLQDAQRALRPSGRNPQEFLGDFSRALTSPGGVSPRDLSPADKRSLLNLRLADRGFDDENAFRSYIDQQVRKGPLNREDTFLLGLLRDVDEAQAKIVELQQTLADLDKTIAGGDATGGGGAVAAQTDSLAGFRTETEKLEAALKRLREARIADGDAAAKALNEYERFEQEDFLDNTEGVKQLEAKRKEFQEAFAKANAADAVRSREAIQVVLDYARSTGNLADALKRLPSLSDVLVSGDTDLLRNELGKFARDFADDMLVGLDAVDAEYAANLKHLEEQSAVARAAGIYNEKAYLDALLELHQDYVDKREAAASEQFGTMSGEDFVRSIDPGEATDQLKKAFKDAGLDDSDLDQFRENMRRSVHDAVKQGIETGDWGDSVRNIFGEAVSSALDHALNNFADALVNLLFGVRNDFSSTGSGWGGLIAAVAGAIFGGGRATGGPVSAGHAYRINENGGEFLYMGNRNGQVLNMAQMSRALGAGGSQPVSIQNNINIAGDASEATVALIRQELAENNRQIMSALPGAIDGRVIESRRYKRY